MDKSAILRLLIYAAGTFVRRMGWPNVTGVASIFPGIRKHNPGITISMAPINSERGTINLIWHLLISGISTFYSNLLKICKKIMMDQVCPLQHLVTSYLVSLPFPIIACHLSILQSTLPSHLFDCSSNCSSFKLPLTLLILLYIPDISIW